MPCRGTWKINVRNHRKTYWHACSADEVNKDGKIKLPSFCSSHPSVSLGHVFWHGFGRIWFTSVTCARRIEAYARTSRTSRNNLEPSKLRGTSIASIKVVRNLANGTFFNHCTILHWLSIHVCVFRKAGKSTTAINIPTQQWKPGQRTVRSSSACSGLNICISSHSFEYKHCIETLHQRHQSTSNLGGHLRGRCPWPPGFLALPRLLQGNKTWQIDKWLKLESPSTYILP